MSGAITIELDAGSKTFATGLLLDLIASFRGSQPGDLLAVTGDDTALGAELEAWCRFTRNSLVAVDVVAGRPRWTIRRGEAVLGVDPERPVGSRLWLYVNFDCNLSCDYCCVRSSPRAPRRALGLEQRGFLDHQTISRAWRRPDIHYRRRAVPACRISAK